MLTRFRVQNYKALRDVVLDLTPVHVLIGPNDSGKTSLLEALAALSASVEDQELSACFPRGWSGQDLVRQGSRASSILLAAEWGTGTSYEVRLDFSGAVVVSGASARVGGRNLPMGESNEGNAPQRLTWATTLARPDYRPLVERLAGARIHRWIPRYMGVPAVPVSDQPFYLAPTGFGLPLCLDDLLGYDRARFQRLEERFRALFPQYRSIRLVREAGFAEGNGTSGQPGPAGVGKGLRFETAEGLIPGTQVSDGVLLTLAYLALFHLPQPPRLLLIEEPENGVHPARLRDIVDLLRALTADHPDTQALLTTHSPYLVDLFAPEEVTLCHRDPDGAVATRRLAESEPVLRQADLFTLGEIWTGEGDESLALVGGSR
jgi:predicted ATPase